MAYCTVQEVRNEDKKFSKVTEVTDVVIEDRIAAAEKQIKVDLSSIISESELDTVGANSKVINLLSIKKAVELTLVAYYGVSRKVDELTDVQYFKKEYDSLLKRIKDEEIVIVSPTETLSPKSYPAVSSGSNRRFYRRKGVDSFYAEGEEAFGETVVDDSIS